MQAWMKAGTLTSRQILSCYFARIDQVDHYTKAILERNPDAYAIADAMDAERASGKVRGPLHGIVSELDFSQGQS
jgi:amidase